MYVRKRLNIGSADILYAMAAQTVPASAGALTRQIEELWATHARHAPPETSHRGTPMALLSVRTGFDLLLTALALPHGSEILMSAITIGDMRKVAESHGLVVVPVDLDPESVGPDLECLRTAVSARTRMLVVAHLFGTLLDVTPLIDFCESQNILFFEDCAQIFTGWQYMGHPRADVVAWSFGSIKTCTALGGGMLTVADADVCARMRRVHKTYVRRPASIFRKKLYNYMFSIWASRPWFLGLVYKFYADEDMWDEFIASFSRGFPGDNLIEQLRMQPDTGMLKLWLRRLRNYDASYVERRRQRGQLAHSLLPADVHLFGESQPHTYWLFPVQLCDVDIERVSKELVAMGYDCSRVTSQIQVVPVPNAVKALRDGRAQALQPKQSALIIDNLLYLPVLPEMPEHLIRDLMVQLRAVLARHRIAEPRQAAVIPRARL